MIIVLPYRAPDAVKIIEQVIMDQPVNEEYDIYMNVLEICEEKIENYD